MAIEALIFSVISAAGQLQAGQAQKEESELNKFNIETDKKFNAVAADQAASLRKQEFDSLMDSNIAALSKTRELTGMTVKNIIEKSKETAFKDIKRIQNQKHWRGIASEMEALAEGRRGRNAKTASLFRATATLGQGISDYQRSK